MATLDDILIKLEKLNKSDDIVESIKNLTLMYNNIKLKQQNLESKVNSLTAENIVLKEQIVKVNSQLDRSNQQVLNCNLEIAGVPSTEFEDTTEIARQIIDNLGFKDKTIIKSAYRRRGKATTAGLPQPIIVSITDKGQRDQILVARKTKNLTSQILTSNIASGSIQSSNQVLAQLHRPIYINEPLTDRNKYLLARAKELKRLNKVIIKSNLERDEIRITNTNQLDEFNT